VPAIKLLIVEDDSDLLALLASHPSVAADHVVAARTLPAALEAIATDTFDVALIDLGLGSDSGLDAIRAVKEKQAKTEIVVMSGTSSLAAAIASYELKAFAFVPKPFDVEHVLSTARRAIEHRQVILANERLAWEQRLLNEVGDELRHLLEPEQLVNRVLRRLMTGMHVQLSAARLRNPSSGTYDFRIVSAPADLHEAWVFSAVPRTSDGVLRTRAAGLIADLHDGREAGAAAKMPIRSALCVPMLAGADLIGVLSVGSADAGCVAADDQRLL
jgi:ActR/RegA family two-component response regulator